MPYGILRFAKMKGGPTKSLEAYHEREKEQYTSNPDVDASEVQDVYMEIRMQCGAALALQLLVNLQKE